jgi:hypothetical protein
MYSDCCECPAASVRNNVPLPSTHLLTAGTAVWSFSSATGTTRLGRCDVARGYVSAACPSGAGGGGGGLLVAGPRRRVFGRVVIVRRRLPPRRRGRGLHSVVRRGRHGRKGVLGVVLRSGRRQRASIPGRCGRPCGRGEGRAVQVCVDPSRVDLVLAAALTDLGGAWDDFRLQQ